MKRVILSVLIAAIILLMTVAVILLANPFKSFFDSLLFPEEEADDSGVGIELLAEDGTNFALNYPKPEALVRDYFSTLRRLEGSVDLDTEGKLRDLYSTQEKTYLNDRLWLYSKTVMAQNSNSSLYFDNCSVRISYDRVLEVNRNFLLVDVTENTTMNYECLDGKTCAAGVAKHTFMLKLDDGSWKINSHEVVGGDYDYTNDVMQTLYRADGYAFSELTYTYLEPYYKRAQEIIRKNIENNGRILLGNSPEIVSESPYPYDRKSAVEYALRWTVNGKSARNTAYESYDEDSMNFVSQCLVAGGIPFDVQGDDRYTQWKWYSSELNYQREHAGCSKSWYNSEAFYDYLMTNDGFGIDTCELSGASMLETGDIVQILLNDGKLRTAIVTSIDYDDEGWTNEIFVTMHSPDRKNVPLSSVCCESLRLIKVLGYKASNF